LQKKQVELTITDNVMVLITTVFVFLHIKQLFASGSAFILNALLGVWVSMTVFDMYARWRVKRSD